MEITKINKTSASAELLYKLEKAQMPDGTVIPPAGDRGPTPKPENDLGALAVGEGMVVRNPHPLLWASWAVKVSNWKRQRNMMFVMHHHKHLDAIEILRLR